MKGLRLILALMLLFLSGCASQEWKEYCQDYYCFDQADQTRIINGRGGGWMIIQSR